MQGVLKEELQCRPHRLERAHRDPSPQHPLQIRGHLRLAGLLGNDPCRTHILIHVPQVLTLRPRRQTRQLHVRDHLLSNRTVGNTTHHTARNTVHSRTPCGSSGLAQRSTTRRSPRLPLPARKSNRYASPSSPPVSHGASRLVQRTKAPPLRQIDHGRRCAESLAIIEAKCGLASCSAGQ